MTDSSWDNGGYGQPTKPGMPTWAKVMLGCGVAAVLAMGTCVGGGMYIAHRIKKDPQGFERRILGLAADQVRAVVGAQQARLVLLLQVRRAEAFRP